MSLLELMLNAKLSKESVGSDTVAAKSTLIKVRLNRGSSENPEIYKKELMPGRSNPEIGSS